MTDALTFLRAESPREKRDVVERLYTAWCSVPELRLGQLLVNAVLPHSTLETAPLFYLEDTVLCAIAEHYAARFQR